MTNRNRKIIFTILFIFVGAAAFMLLKSYIFSNIRTRLIDKLEALKVSGFNVQYDSIYLDWRRNVLFIENLVLEKNAYDTSCLHPEFIAVGEIRATGFRLLPLFFEDKLSFKSVNLKNPHLVIWEDSRLMADSSTQRENEFSLEIDKISITEAHIEFSESKRCDLITGFKTHLTLTSLSMDFQVDQPFLFSADMLVLNGTHIRLPKELYTFRIKQTNIDFSKGMLQLDSLHIIPDLGQQEYGRKMGREIDRFEGVVPRVRSTNFSFSYRDSIVIRADMAEIQFYLKIFRDRRLPFKNKLKPLPIAGLKNLPFTLLLDSLRIQESFVQYEEFGAEATEPGGVYFDNLNAVILGLKNRSDEGETKLNATASFMGRGQVQLYVTIPWNADKKTQLAGTLKNFQMSAINPMLQPATNMKVESGNMEELAFRFNYNDYRSDGEIQLNYTDLKLITFKEKNGDNGKKKEATEKDNFKTFILNTFIVRKNMDKEVSEEKRTGTVMFYRDKRKSIFNYWVKSLMSGVKSAYNLEKIAAQKNKREIRKEEKLTKRQARKQRRAERRKERG